VGCLAKLTARGILFLLPISVLTQAELENIAQGKTNNKQI
jgi:hypothetical protein